jgi:YhcH/YjgK/YiaL family protein
MILDALARADLYVAVQAGFADGFQYLRTLDFTTVADGKYPLANSRIMAIVSRYRTKPMSEAVWESHRRHIDIQYVVQGRERCGYASLDRGPRVTVPYDEQKDVQFHEPGRDLFDLTAGYFAVFFPHDVHAPNLADGEPADVLKVVLKVPVE